MRWTIKDESMLYTPNGAYPYSLWETQGCVPVSLVMVIGAYPPVNKQERDYLLFLAIHEIMTAWNVKDEEMAKLLNEGLFRRVFVGDVEDANYAPTT